MSALGDTPSEQQGILSAHPVDTSYLPGYIGSLLADTLSPPSGNLFPRTDILSSRQGTVYQMWDIEYLMLGTASSKGDTEYLLLGTVSAEAGMQYS